MSPEEIRQGTLLMAERAMEEGKEFVSAPLLVSFCKRYRREQQEAARAHHQELEQMEAQTHVPSSSAPSRGWWWLIQLPDEERARFHQLVQEGMTADQAEERLLEEQQAREEERRKTARQQKGHKT